MRYSWFAVGLISVGMLAGCSSGSSDDRAGQAPPTATVVHNVHAASLPSVAQVTARLVTLKDLPAGWIAQPVSGPQPSDTGLCNAGHPSAETERIAVFDGPTPNTEIAENLYGLSSASAAKAAFSFATSHATCTTYQPTNTPLTLTLKPFSFPAQGQQSAAWRATIANAQTGVRQNGDVILIRDGRYNLAVIERTTTTVSTDLFRSIVNLALVNLDK